MFRCKFNLLKLIAKEKYLLNSLHGKSKNKVFLKQMQDVKNQGHRDKLKTKFIAVSF